jgi:ribose transport system substrate-binding protein
VNQIHDDDLTRRSFLGHGVRGAIGTSALGGVLFSLAGCSRQGSDSSNSASAGGGQVSTVGFDHPNNQVPIWQDIMRWSRVAAQNLDAKLLTTADNGQLDKQVGNLENWINRKIPSIICYPLEPTAVEKIAKRARSKGIVWVSYAAKLENQDGSVQLNNSQSGELLGAAAAKFVNEKHGGKAKVLHLTFPDGGQLGKERDDGVRKAFKRDAPNAEIVASQKAVDTGTGLNVTSAVLSAHPDLTVVMGINDDGAVGAYRAFLDRGHKANDPDIWIGGQDGAKPALNLIKKGTMYRASVALSMKELGEACVRTPLDIANGKLKKGSDVNVPVHLLTTADTDQLNELISQLG